MKQVVIGELQGTQKCSICGKEETPYDYINQKELETHQMCFHCNFWREILEKDKKRLPHTWSVIDGTHYVIEPDDNSKSHFKGFGGAEFHIHFKDGHEVITHNLWCQGEPKEYWKEKFPDNADFDWKWQKINEINYLVSKEEIPDPLISLTE